MADANAPIQLKPIPDLVTHVAAAFGPINLKNFFQQSDENPLRFSARLVNDKPFPDGVIVTETGIISGIPKDKTEGIYEVELKVLNKENVSLLTKFKFTIKERIELADPLLVTKIKAQIWEALGHNLPLPDLDNLLERPITGNDVFYLLQRFAFLVIWDVYNLDPAGDKVLLNLPDMNPHYNIYDRGSCLVVAPKDLYSHERTLEDALQASRVLAQEVYKRGWAIEFSGFNKMVRAAWVELQHLGDKHGKKLEIFHYQPDPADKKIYLVQAATSQFRPGE